MKYVALLFLVSISAEANLYKFKGLNFLTALQGGGSSIPGNNGGQSHNYCDSDAELVRSAYSCGYKLTSATISDEEECSDFKIQLDCGWAMKAPHSQECPSFTEGNPQWGLEEILSEPEGQLAISYGNCPSSRNNVHETNYSSERSCRLDLVRARDPKTGQGWRERKCERANGRWTNDESGRNTDYRLCCLHSLGGNPGGGNTGVGR